MLASLRKATAVASLLTSLMPLTKAQLPVSSETFNNIKRYTDFASAAYADNCARPPYGSVAVKYFSDASTDTQATLFRDDAAKEVIISFRGTSTPQDISVDFDFPLTALTAVGTKCPSCQVHTGFQSAYQSISAPVTSEIQQQLASHSGYSLTVTGHSLGAGLASIATSSLIGQGLPVANTYTFGEPLNGDAKFASYISSQIPNSRYYRVTHANDGVPQIPPSLLGFAHHGTEFFQKKQSGNTAATTLNCGVGSISCNAAQLFGLNPINLAHLTYSDSVIGSSLFIAACGAVFPSI